MSIPAPDQQTFHWIKGALDGSMEAVLSQVELAEKDGDYSQLMTVPGNLQQINGSLRMVELEAAGILAEDLEQLCVRVSQDSSEQAREIVTLKQGVETLQAYVDAISRQTPVSPLGLVDQINAVRELTARPGLTRFDLFDPPLSLLTTKEQNGTGGDGSTASGARRSIPDDLRMRLVPQLRRKYRRALVGWLSNRSQGGSSTAGLEKISVLLQHLYRISSLDISQQLWWVAGGFVDALAAGDLEPDQLVKSQFAKLDFEISRLEEESLTAIAVEPPDQLLRRMLFFIGAIEGAESARVLDIQRSLNLTDWFDKDDSQYRKLVETSNELKALGALYNRQSFNELEQAVDSCFSSASAGRSVDVAGVSARIDELDEAVSESGPAALASLLVAVKEALRGLSERKENLANTQTDIKIASALLFIRESTTSADDIDVSWLQSVESHRQELAELTGVSDGDGERALRVRRVAQVEYQHARSAVATQIREILTVIEKQLDVLNNVTGSADGSVAEADSALSGLADSATGVASVFDVADNELASQVANGLAAHIRGFERSLTRPESDNLEHLAFALAALGVAADQLSRRGPEADNVLRAALDRLDEVDSPQPDYHAQDESGNVQESAPDAGTDLLSNDTGSDFDDDSEPLGDAIIRSLVETLDYQRRQLGGDNHDGVRGLMESFESLAEFEESPSAVSQLSSMGSAICLDLIENEAGVSAEKQDFFGLLVRQLRDLTTADSGDAGDHGGAPDHSAAGGEETADPDQGVDLDAWSNRVRALTNSRLDGATLLKAASADEEQAWDEDSTSDDLDPLESDSESVDDDIQFESDRLDRNDGNWLAGQGAVDRDHSDRDQSGLVQLDLDLRTIFVEEFGSHLHRLREGLNEYRQTESGTREATAAISEMDDCVHTLSGNCRNLGFDEAAGCAEAALSTLVDDRSVDRNVRMVRFAESLVLLGQCRQQIKQEGQYDADTAAALVRYINREDDSAEQSPQTDLTGEQSPQTDLTGEQSNGSPDDSPDALADESSDESHDQAEANSEDTASDDDTLPLATAPGLADAEEEIDEEIRQIFIEESQSILGRINGHLITWRTDGADTGALAGIRREFHTLKGSAAATGFNEISRLSHRVESLLEDQPLDQASIDPGQSARILDLLEEMHDGLSVETGILHSDSGSELSVLDHKLDVLLGIEVDEEPEQDSASHSESGNPGAEVHQAEVAEAEAEPEPVAVEPEAAAETEPESVLVEAEAEAAESEAEAAEAAGEPVEAAADTAEQSDTRVGGNSSSGESIAGPAAEAAAEPEEPAGQPGGGAEASPASGIERPEIQQWMPGETTGTRQQESADDATAGSMLRIGNTRLAELINASGEMTLVRTQLQDTLDATRMDLDVLRTSMSTMRAGLRDLEMEADAQIRARPEQQAVSVDDEFDPLQLDRYSGLQAKSREVTEMLDQLAKVERDLGSRTSNLDGALRQQQHLGDQLQSGLMSARMVSMAEYLPRLRYLVRETSRQAGKPVEFAFGGGDIQVDRQVIEVMVAPFEHMIRNAVAHGIEQMPDRRKAGKPDTGSISLTLVQQGSELVVTFSDDGKGLDLERLGTRAVELGLATSKDAVAEVELLQVITQPGYSTAESLTMEAGRGVGMDVVYQAVRDLGGSMSLDNRPGQGVTFQFRLPVTLALTQALLVKVAGWQFAVRSRTIERLIRVAVNDVHLQNGERVIMVDETYVTLFSVRDRLDQPPLSGARAFLNVVLVRLADRLAAFEVDEFDDSVNIVSKALGRQLAAVPEISGVTVLGDSTVVLILDPESFVDRIAPVRAAIERTAEPPPVGALRRVLVVDDSLVVRKVMQKDLEADGLEVETAVDGLNALEVLDSVEVDVALVDIEMPRMNGYELLQKLRDDSRHSKLPVIIITSRSGDQHRQRAMSLGADGYITKPYDITALDKLMREVVASKHKLH